MKVLIIGGVAAGTKTAAKLKREDRSVEVVILTKSKQISYAGCGLPYYVGGAIEQPAALVVNTPQSYAALTGVEVWTGQEAVKLLPAHKEVVARQVETGEERAFTYDKLVIATGASPVLPPVTGTDQTGVFTLRTPDDAVRMREEIRTYGVQHAVVVGAGFIGLETAENLLAQGIQVTVLDVAPQIMPNVFDSEMAAYATKQLLHQGVRVWTGTRLQEIVGDGRVHAVQTDRGRIPAELVVVCAGIRPNTAFLQDSGIEMVRGAIVTDAQLQTNLPDIYAAGDCALVTNRITGRTQWSAMGSSANLEGRTLAQTLAGRPHCYPGVLGTGVAKLPGINCSRTGLTERQAKEAGYAVETVLAVTEDKPSYYPGAATFCTKLIADKHTHQLLGMQVLGQGAVDKMADIAVMAMSMGAVLEDFDNLDFAYAPPFSTAIHPLLQAVYILLNKLSGRLVSMTPAEYLAGKAEGYRVIDASLTPSIPGATYVALSSVQGELPGIAKEEPLLLVCNKGKRAYFLQNRLAYYGYVNTVVLEGATYFNDVKVANPRATVSPDEVTRVKSLGFLRDKTTPDRFNGRVITRNGKISAAESRAIAEAAERFGSGEIAMTSRLTVEIQGVPYENIEPLRDFLMRQGLETGGTGSKVRPVVSCKGTTCQYGLIDTFALSEKIHERFYRGYHEVKLPHKFKLAVGGCPNNCVKPDLNDLGIIGQRVPQIELSKCRGCKTCQVELACPIQVAKMADGKIQVDPDACNRCGRCIGKCPFGAFERHIDGYRVYIGGRWGKKVAQGRMLDHLFTSEDEVLDLVEKAILLFREQGNTGERFADTVARIGFDQVQQQLLSDDLLARKQQNLQTQKHMTGGATC